MQAVIHKVGRLAGGVVLGAAVLSGGTAAASDYPPDATTATTVVSARSVTANVADPNVGDPAGVGGQLPETGSDIGATLTIAGAALIAGCGIIVASKVRRRPATA